MKLTKKFTIGAATTLSILSLAACGKSSTAIKSSSDSNEIVFWNPNSGADHPVLQKMVDKYNATNPKYKVKNISFKENTMYSKIPAAVNAGKGIPDLTIVHAERLKQYQANGMLVNLDKDLQAFPDINAKNYIPEAWKQGAIDNSQYAVPLDIHNWGTYYNKSLVQKYAPHAMDDGIITFDEIEQAGLSAKKDGIQGVAYDWIKPNYMGMLKQEGGDLTSNGEDPTLDTAPSKAAITLMANQYKEGITVKDGQDALKQFLSGKLMFLPEGIWMYDSIKVAKFDWGLTNSPQLTSDKAQAVNWASSHQFVMFKSKDRDAAKEKGVMEFLDWMRTHSSIWATAGMNPASLEAQTDSSYKKMPQFFFVSTPEEQATLHIFNYKYNGYVADYLDAHALDAIYGKTPVDTFTKGMQQTVVGQIQQNK